MEVLNEVGEYPIANRYVLPDQITVLLRRIIWGSEVRYRDLSPYLHWFEKHIQFVYVHVHEIQTRSSQHVHSILYSDTNMVHSTRSFNLNSDEDTNMMHFSESAAKQRCCM